MRNAKFVLVFLAMFGMLPAFARCNGCRCRRPRAVAAKNVANRPACKNGVCRAR